MTLSKVEIEEILEEFKNLIHSNISSYLLLKEPSINSVSNHTLQELQKISVMQSKVNTMLTTLVSSRSSRSSSSKKSARRGSEKKIYGKLKKINNVINSLKSKNNISIQKIHKLRNNLTKVNKQMKLKNINNQKLKIIIKKLQIKLKYLEKKK